MAALTICKPFINAFNTLYISLNRIIDQYMKRYEHEAANTQSQGGDFLPRQRHQDRKKEASADLAASSPSVPRAGASTRAPDALAT